MTSVITTHPLEHSAALTGYLRVVHPAWQHNQPKAGPVFTRMVKDESSFEAMAMRVASHREKRAFSALFSHFAPRIKSWLVRHGLGTELSEELTQDVLITVWQKAAQFDPGKARFSTWLFRIARNRMIDHMRRKKYPEVNCDDHMSCMIAEDRTEQPLETAQDIDLVRKALAGLTDTQRQVLELSFMEELSHSLIAQRLGIPLGTVKSRIRIAFNTLRTELEDKR